MRKYRTVTENMTLEDLKWGAAKAIQDESGGVIQWGEYTYKGGVWKKKNQ